MPTPQKADTCRSGKRQSSAVVTGGVRQQQDWRTQSKVTFQRDFALAATKADAGTRRRPLPLPACLSRSRRNRVALTAAARRHTDEDSTASDQDGNDQTEGSVNVEKSILKADPL